MNIRIEQGLPYITAALTYGDQSMTLDRVLLDTGSAGTVFSADNLLKMNLRMDIHDSIHRIRGIGGAEFVYTKQIDFLSVGDLGTHNFPIEVGAMDYGITLDGIVGMDFLLQVGAIIDLAEQRIS